MRKASIIFIVCLIMPLHHVCGATTRAMRSGTTATERTANPMAGYNYNYMYPYMNNEMRTALNPGVTTSQSTSPINAVVRTEQLSAPRRVVARPTPNNTARVANSNTSNRRVVARSASNGGGRYTQRTTVTARDSGRDNAIYTNAIRGDTTQLARARAAAMDTPMETTAEPVSSSRCLADYIDCMEGYCKRADAAYNRCYCSSKLAQIDSQYKDQIEKLLLQIVELRGTNTWTQSEMDEYWMSVVGKYSGQNSWANLDQALNIDWASTESRVRGAQAFTTGHEYCTQHLKACYYMATNMRDVYVSQISRDCQSYEQALQVIKNAAESIVETYK